MTEKHTRVLLTALALGLLVLLCPGCSKWREKPGGKGARSTRALEGAGSTARKSPPKKAAQTASQSGAGVAVQSVSGETLLAIPALPHVDYRGGGPADTLYVASTHLRVIDVARGEITAAIPLGHHVRDMEFSPDGSLLFVAAAGGLFVFDTAENRQLARIIEQPVKDVMVDAPARKLHVLSHSWHRAADGRGVAGPSHLSTFSLDSLRLEGDQEVGTRIQKLARGPGSAVVAADAVGHFAIYAPGRDARALSPSLPLGRGLRYLLSTEQGRQLIVPVEGVRPSVQVIDTESGAARDITLPHEGMYVRGAVLSPDGNALYLNALTALAVVDLRREQEMAWIPTRYHHQAVALGSDGRTVYLALPVFRSGGGITVVNVAEQEVLGVIDVPDISPFTVAVKPR